MHINQIFTLFSVSIDLCSVYYSVSIYLVRVVGSRWAGWALQWGPHYTHLITTCPLGFSALLCHCIVSSYLVHPEIIKGSGLE